MATTLIAMSIRAEDGRHCHYYKSVNEALAALAEQMGRDALGLEICKRYVDDWGRTMRLDTLPEGMTAAEHKQIGPAYDARECGTLTKAQRALLAKWGY